MNPVGSMTGLVLTIGASVFGFTVSTWGIKWNQKSIDELARLRQDAHDMAGKVANCLQMLLEEVMDVLHQ
ncbi:hypothetical protein M427DRAFT_58061 [Gonapodya prolifera JEL478]|uniref:Uncharacterized protein n=1 Tax=Gonapodya prolifera (strain JEL478) TaxID=1344416 RepID=A0A139AAQ0_GONPJ|nr:hypothetical protein M427DRAFT_58061 [Gonapodya prolifera JEL478]|eukprot:KXS13817.1 hypothetical protein M427DRAFT_58061 [Gonapodya prolifera JEL478]